MEKLIHADQITYAYPSFDDSGEETSVKKKTNALDGISLEVEKGQFICILGTNGSGKSTLARHLNALLFPDSGTVWIGEMDTKNQEYLWNIRSRVGMVFQNPDNQMIASRIDEEVAFGLENTGVPSEQIFRRVQDSLDSVGLSEYGSENPLNLSGGQKQRVAVAGVLAMRPECIVLDESTAMLDPKGRTEIMRTVRDIHKNQGVTIICITHYMEEALDADRIFVMNKGKVVLQGTPHEIFCQEEALSRAGLMLPVICQLAARLRSMGADIPKDLITAEELRGFIHDYQPE